MNKDKDDINENKKSDVVQTKKDEHSFSPNVNLSAYKPLTGESNDITFVPLRNEEKPAEKHLTAKEHLVQETSKVCEKFSYANQCFMKKLHVIKPLIMPCIIIQIGTLFILFFLFSMRSENFDLDVFPILKEIPQTKKSLVSLRSTIKKLEETVQGQTQLIRKLQENEERSQNRIESFSSQLEGLLKESVKKEQSIAVRKAQIANKSPEEIKAQMTEIWNRILASYAKTENFNSDLEELLEIAPESLQVKIQAVLPSTKEDVKSVNVLISELYALLEMTKKTGIPSRVDSLKDIFNNVIASVKNKVDEAISIEDTTPSKEPLTDAYNVKNEEEKSSENKENAQQILIQKLSSSAIKKLDDTVRKALRMLEEHKFSDAIKLLDNFSQKESAVSLVLNKWIEDAKKRYNFDKVFSQLEETITKLIKGSGS